MNFLEKVSSFLIVFAGALLLTLVLTPIVREFNRRIGLVDKPDARRINKVPIPRGGGIALVLGVLVSFTLYIVISGRPPLQSPGFSSAQCLARYWKMLALSVSLALIGYADDKFSLPPKVKLLGQLVIAALTWAWAGLGFHVLWPAIPAWLDAIMTVFWITGAVNAFNLIDGLDGLASGLALVATVGMTGSILLLPELNAQMTLFHFAFMGGLLGFLRYNYNPASVFLGDSGSMYIGYTIAVLPLLFQVPNSFLVSVGVPMLAMGVPIFDTSLAILRRSIRAVLRRRDAGEQGNGEVMTADSDHLHHRILRASGLNQRKAAWTLYVLAAFLVTVGLIGLSLRSKAAGLWLFAFCIGAVIVFKDMARIELFDAGRLAAAVIRNPTVAHRRRFARLYVPIHLAADIGALVAMFFVCRWALKMPMIGIGMSALRIALPIFVASVMAFLFFFNAYRTVWSRAMPSNYLRLTIACVLGSALASVFVYYAPGLHGDGHLKAFALAYAATAALSLISIRFVRALVRDLFYAIDCSKLKGRKDVSRVLVYGAGLRYRTFRRELVRTTAANDRIIVGLLDDDILLRHQYIGGIRILGTLRQAPEIIKEVNADTVVIACVVTPEWMKVVKKTLEPTGVKVTVFKIGEEELDVRERSDK